MTMTRLLLEVVKLSNMIESAALSLVLRLAEYLFLKIKEV